MSDNDRATQAEQLADVPQYLQIFDPWRQALRDRGLLGPLLGATLHLMAVDDLRSAPLGAGLPPSPPVPRVRRRTC